MRKPADSPRREEICLRLCDVGGAAMVLINKPLWSFRWGALCPSAPGSGASLHTCRGHTQPLRGSDPPRHVQPALGDTAACRSREDIDRDAWAHFQPAHIDQSAWLSRFQRRIGIETELS